VTYPMYYLKFYTKESQQRHENLLRTKGISGQN